MATPACPQLHRRAILVAAGSAFVLAQAGPACAADQAVIGKVARLTSSTSEASVPLTLQEAVRLILSQGQPILNGVKEAGGQFLYRGETLPAERGGASSAALRVQPPDLLDTSTYGSKAAAEYFAALDAMLEKEFAAEARPSTAHIVVANAQAAAEWGEACSIWPVGSPLEWTWLEHTFELWDKGWEQPDGGGSLLNGNRGAFFWREEGALHEYLEAGVIVDKGLAEAIRSGHEILIQSGPLQPPYKRGVANAYVAVPARLDDALRDALGVPLQQRSNPRELFNDSGRVGVEAWSYRPQGGTAGLVKAGK
ncbi:hypothetical protein JKP88DRAFT_199519 [Tribonema minus]|uniref:Uncharacterized protein n=1 Tax=Tribonema minus TaxID=303371 RepID=A0A835YZG2_9STRA|nr:hypothetical protein JKP88DRAFT_199519 [Tribonema minus]